MRDRRIDFLVSANERAQMAKAAAICSLSPSAWLRRVALRAAKNATKRD